MKEKGRNNIDDNGCLYISRAQWPKLKEISLGMQ